MARLFQLFICFAVIHGIAFAQADSVIVGKVPAVSPNDTVLVPVYFAIGEGFCFGHIRFTWASADEGIEAVGIMPGTAGGWQLAVDSLDTANNIISVIGENFQADQGGRMLPFYLVFALKNPGYQVVSIGTDNTLRLGTCDGLGGIEPAFAPGEIRYFGYLPGDANASGYLSGVDLIYIASYLSGKGSSLANPRAADVNGDCATDSQDITYLIQYFKGRGPEPISGDCQ